MRLEQQGVDWRWVGSPTASVRLGGHSHMLAFRYSMELLDERLRSAVAILDVAEGYVAPDDSYWERLAGAGTPTGVVWAGNQHSVSFLLSAAPLTIVRRSARTPPDVRGRVVPYAMVQALWQPSLEGLVDFLAGHPDPGSVVVVGTPPPKADEQIRAGIAVEPFFVELLEREGLTPATAPLLDTATRVAAWEALQDAMRSIATRAGAGFLDVSDALRSPDGTLRPEYGAGDATHANPAYGAVMWRCLVERVEGTA